MSNQYPYFYPRYSNNYTYSFIPSVPISKNNIKPTPSINVQPRSLISNNIGLVPYGYVSPYRFYNRNKNCST